MGDRGQGLVNKQVLKDCDLLIGVFWTRLGTPTGVASSGTVEEIREHMAAGKPTMLYFSDAPIEPGRVDPVQYEQLQRFRDECKNCGLVETYKNYRQFETKLSRQLHLTILGNRDLFRESIWKI